MSEDKKRNNKKEEKKGVKSWRLATVVGCFGFLVAVVQLSV
jgi:hypothetical protein